MVYPPGSGSAGEDHAGWDGMDPAWGTKLEEGSTQAGADPQTSSPSLSSEQDWSYVPPTYDHEWLPGPAEERIPKDALGGSHRHDPAADFDTTWPRPDEFPNGWTQSEVDLPAPSGPHAIAALLHGDNPEFFIYALVLARQIWEQAEKAARSTPRSKREGHRDTPPDRVLICGPGCITESAENRKALREAGWTHLLPVSGIEASHLDKTSRKRHAMVFTKLKVLELPYRQILLIDIDLLPREGCDLSELLKIQAPAAKYHCSSFKGKYPNHGELIPENLVANDYWCPNCGVLRVDPLPRADDRRQLVQEMVDEVQASSEAEASYLPEQYYLSRFKGWRQISHLWNWEVWPQFDDPDMTHPTWRARKEMQRLGWGTGDRGSWHNQWQQAKVWHFSGTGETSPFNLAHLSANEARRESERSFQARDPSKCIATAHFEWISALDRLEQSVHLTTAAACLRQWRIDLRRTVSLDRGPDLRMCAKCRRQTYRARRLTDLPYYDGKWCKSWQPVRGYWCRDCVVEVLLRGPKDCSCEVWERNTYRWSTWWDE
mmetsp:Transcript_30549/g.65816  ORF Transcript_30549/g.65816 Transcript_30549/m.65816 type:complete len:546 (+) Transcript_30549:129-1766(+)